MVIALRDSWRPAGAWSRASSHAGLGWLGDLRDTLKKVFELSPAFHADGKSVDRVLGHGEPQRLVHPITQLALAQYLHAEDALAVGFQIGHERQHLLCRSIHAD